MIRLVTALVAALMLTACSLTAPIATTEAIGPAKQNTPDASEMELLGYAFPPPAFYDFCAKEPRLCSTSGGAQAVTLTPQRMAELKAVNVAVNRRIKERSDRASSGKADEWRLPVSVGDCEDFAILKKQELLRQGWPASALLLTVARRGSTGHVVLTVRTDRGDFVLDNMTNAVKDWSKTPYSYFARQSQSKHGKWERISSTPKKG